jgi:hypothetical protein
MKSVKREKIIFSKDAFLLKREFCTARSSILDGHWPSKRIRDGETVVQGTMVIMMYIQRRRAEKARLFGRK